MDVFTDINQNDEGGYPVIGAIFPEGKQHMVLLLLALGKLVRINQEVMVG